MATRFIRDFHKYQDDNWRYWVFESDKDGIDIPTIVDTADLEPNGERWRIDAQGDVHVERDE
jgi:hypothetical protein